MPTKGDIRWFKTQFHSLIDDAIKDTPLTQDFIVALACQETGEVWPLLRNAGLPLSTITALCVGDTLDEDRGRKAFPRTKAHLLTQSHGEQMFQLGHQALVDMAKYVPSYATVAKRPNKFCHGYGVFQLDLQFFRKEPDFFLNREWATFEGSLQRAMVELKQALIDLSFEHRQTPLTDLELAQIGIVYNTGTFKPAKGLMQGHFDGTKFYGQSIFDFIRQCHTVSIDDTAPALATPLTDQAALADPTTIANPGTLMRVDTLIGMLRVRSEPAISDPSQANVVANLPDGHPVSAISGAVKKGFLEIETSLAGAYIRGFASKKYLVAAPEVAPIAPALPTQVPGAMVQEAAKSSLGVAGEGSIPAVFMPRKPGSITRRSGPANAHSLNEPNQPSRRGGSPQDLRASIETIVAWLDVEKTEHVRYQPHDGLTYCNVYAHDFCLLAGVYLPRCWWTSKALLKIASGEEVQPLIGNTISEMRANDLFRWLRDFGLAFGWRQTGTLSKLQTEVNQGAVGVIVARRKEDGRSGHIVLVVPESPGHTGKRNGAGEVIAPLQSQAGARNFSYGLGTPEWWRADQFAEFAFWLHA